MRITKQSSGGRGEYELCDCAPDGRWPHDLLNHILHLKVHDIEINTGVMVTNAQDKYRLRLTELADQHAHLQLAIMLLLPLPVRDETKIASGEPVLQNKSYIIKNINFGDVLPSIPDSEHQRFVANVSTIDAANSTVTSKQIAVLQRMQDIERIWQHRSDLPSEISSLLKAHEKLVRSGGPLKRVYNKIVQNIQLATETASVDLDAIYSHHTDVVPVLFELTNQTPTQIPIMLNEIEPDNIELRRRQAAKWRRYAQARGAASTKFRHQVRQAYDWRCLICAARFPSTPINLEPGIDAAHILPWSEYELDEVYNGIALCKLHHWAFDEKLLLITYRQGAYHVELSPEAEDVLYPTEFSIDVLRESVGQIPSNLLPRQQEDWPKPALLERLYRESV